VFDYEAATGNVRLIQLKGLALPVTVKCGTTLAVAGTTESGAIAVKPNTADQCQDSYRWQIDSATGELRRVRRVESIISLYERALN
jgi:hypothetical protein